VLEAVAAAPAGDHLVGQIVDVENNRPSRTRIEVLEHDRRRVGPVDGGKAGRLAPKADAIEVGAEVEAHVRTLDRVPWHRRPRIWATRRMQGRPRGTEGWFRRTVGTTNHSMSTGSSWFGCRRPRPDPTKARAT